MKDNTVKEGEKRMKKKAKQACIGWVWLKDQQRPIVAIHQIDRKNLYIITLGSGQRKKIKGEDIIELREKGE